MEITKRITKLEQIDEIAKTKKGRIVVPMAHNEEALKAVKMAVDEGWISGGSLIGDVAKIKGIAVDIHLNLQDFKLMDVIDAMSAAREAVKMLIDKKVDFLLKGIIDTKIYMRAILNKEFGLVPEGNLLSHVAIMQIPKYHKLLGITDVAVNIYPGFEEKKKMIENIVGVFHKMGIERPKVAIICPIEKVNGKIQSTVDAGNLVEYFKDRDDLIVEGPYDFYIAVSKRAAEEKGVVGEVCGDADILVFPNLDSANPVYKVINQFIPDERSAAIVAGAKIPIILPSRADSADTKKLSIALCSFLA